ncbi:obscurin-like, partial [Astatotilapia calliptera]|uniref:obscurin-like n=1 Tax=Astatotilapia calliptera TaxID=8154 RepID=UPI000E4034A6
MHRAASKCRATLTAQSSVIPAGGSVTLNCSVEGSAGWNVYWFRSDSVSSEIQLIREGETNRVISVSQGGLYHCRGGRGDPVYFTEESNEVTITETASKPKAKLTAQSLIIPVGGSVTLSCSVNPSSSSGWKYYWYRDEKSSEALTTQDAVFHSNGQISVSQEGLYRCRGGRGNPVYYTEDSQSVRIGKTGSVLTVSPSWLSPGASVTLNCEVEHPSAGWSFYWYKAVPDLSEKSSSYELLPDGSGTAQDSYIIHGQTHTAGYVCRAGRGDPEYHTDHSQPKFVWSADVHSAASLTVSPDRVQHFTSDSVSLTCEGNFTEWRVRKFSEDGRLSDCRRMTGSTCDINTSKSDTAVYWCESGSGEFSSAVNITVQNDGNGPILVSPVHPVTEGASVSLSCSLRTQKILSNVFFYHNDKLIQNDPRGEVKISAVSKSDEGFYKCQYSGRESAQSWMSVKGADSSSSPVWLMVGLVSGVSLIIILLLLLYCCRQSKFPDETRDVTYSLIKLKDFEKRRKHHKPEECVIYSEVKTGAAEDSLMYAEVKQAK